MDKATFKQISTGTFESRLFGFMRSVGLNQIQIEYSGGGDSGGMDNMEFDWGKSEKKQAVEEIIRQYCEDDLCQPIYNRHGSFADGGGYSVNGKVVWDAKNSHVWIEGTDHFYEYNYDEETNDYEETDERDEEWSEDILTEIENSDEFDCQFLYMYAVATHSKFSEEFHNRLLIEAANKDSWAVKYIKECK